MFYNKVKNTILMRNFCTICIFYALLRATCKIFQGQKIITRTQFFVGKKYFLSAVQSKISIAGMFRGYVTVSDYRVDRRFTQGARGSHKRACSVLS